MNELNSIHVKDLAADVPASLATGPFGSQIGSRFFRECGVPVLRGSNLSAEIGIRLNENGLVFIDEDLAKTFGRSTARRGDLVFTCWGTIDQVGLITGDSRFDRYIVSNKQMKLTPDPRKASSLYLYYYFSSPAVRKEIVANGIGTSVPGFNLGQLKAWHVPLPSLCKQEQIASVLGSFDKQISLLERQNATLEAAARAVFRSWFVDFDPVRAKLDGRRPHGLDDATAALFPDGFEHNNGELVPHGWRQMPMSEAVEVNPKRSLKKKRAATYLEMRNVPTAGHRPTAVATRAFTSGTKFVNGDTLMARITPCLENGKTAYVDFLRDGEVGWGSTEFLVLRPKPPLPTFFGYLLARDPEFRQFAIQQMTGSSGRQRVPADSLSGYRIAVPDEDVAEAFGRRCQPYFDLIRANSEESATLAELRDALLPKLLSGELTVPDVEALTEAPE
ncbi:restriction endonuclease subunit S [Alienimonas chondri]|uniref:Type I restriction modification DNA specificity domain-containing protein n=1 Tax=Alienimonas chondri TaxID=2681879 RepID=A0ABX1V9Q4_9PLAN|nr:restriction endonuclease subunit S [Alienimonas chondri]NNJ24641.1 hypothetical protein [Alienimonas chondri]